MNNYVINYLPYHNDAHILSAHSTIIIQTTWNDESIDFNLYCDKKGLRGTLLKSALATTASALELNIDEFMVESRKALCSQNGLPNFTYILDQSAFKFCKKTTEGFHITYGEVQLEVQPDVIDEILTNSIKLNERKDDEINLLRSDMRRTDNSFNEMKIALEKCVQEKVQMENSLLTKFAAVLNAKKDKIAELERAIKNGSIDHLESDGSGDSDMDYSSQICVREKQTPTPVIIHPAASVAVVPKRSKNIQKVTEAEAEISKPKSSTESMDIYERETEMLLDDM